MKNKSMPWTPHETVHHGICQESAPWKLMANNISFNMDSATKKRQTHENWSVGGFNPSEKYKSNWKSSPNRVEHKTKYLKPPPRKPLTKYHGHPRFLHFLGLKNPIFWGLKTFIITWVLGSKGYRFTPLPRKLTWPAGKSPKSIIGDTSHRLKCLCFHCHVRFQGGKKTTILAQHHIFHQKTYHHLFNIWKPTE